MTSLLTKINWQLAVAAGVAIFTVVAYVLTRRRELAWKRTEFLFGQAQFLDSDPDLNEVVTILEDRHSRISVRDIFDGTSAFDSAERKEYLQKFDKLLNLLWRLCYAHLETKTISLKEIQAFGWYLWRISESPSLAEYCEDNGFDEIIVVIKALKPSWDEDDDTAKKGPGA